MSVKDISPTAPTQEALFTEERHCEWHGCKLPRSACPSAGSELCYEETTATEEPPLKVLPQHDSDEDGSLASALAFKEISDSSSSLGIQQTLSKNNFQLTLNPDLTEY